MLSFAPPDSLTPGQWEVAAEGFKATQKTVPTLEDRDDARRAFILDSEMLPIGCLTEIPLGDNAVEVGVRFWAFTPRIAMILADWIGGLLRSYDAVVARVYRNNWPVKKLLVRGGFRLFKVEGRTEFFIVTPEAYMGHRRG